MKKFLLLSLLVSAGTLFLVLTAGSQTNEYDTTETASPPVTAPATQGENRGENETLSSSPPAEHPSPVETPTIASPAVGQQTLVSSATVVGVTVKNAQGEAIGELQEIMIDPQSGKVMYGMVTYSGQWGMGKQKSFAVPWEALKVAFNQTDVVVELEPDKLSLPSHIELSKRQ